MAVVNNIEESLVTINSNILRMFQLREYNVDIDIHHNTLLHSQTSTRFEYNYVFDSPSRNMTTFVYTFKMADIVDVTLQKKGVESCYETFINDKKKRRNTSAEAAGRVYTLALIIGKTNTTKMNHIEKNVRLVRKREGVKFEVFNKTFFALFPPDHYLVPEHILHRNIGNIDGFLREYHVYGRICPMIYHDDVMSILYDANIGDYFLIKRPSESSGTALMVRKVVRNPRSKR